MGHSRWAWHLGRRDEGGALVALSVIVSSAFSFLCADPSFSVIFSFWLKNFLLVFFFFWYNISTDIEFTQFLLFLFFPEKDFISPLFLKYIFSGAVFRVNSLFVFSFTIQRYDSIIFGLLGFCVPTYLTCLLSLECFQHFLYIFVVVTFSSVRWYPKWDFVLFWFVFILFGALWTYRICGLKSHLFWRILGPILLQNLFFLDIVYILNVWYGLTALKWSILYFLSYTFSLCISTG